MKKSILALSLSAFMLTLAGCSEDTTPNKKDEAKSEVTKEQVKKTDNTLDFELLFPNEEIREYAKAMIGTEAPDFEMQNLAGKEVKLSDLKGKNVIVEVASTTCPACIEAHPSVDKFKKLSEGEVTVLTVFPNENKEAVEKFFTTNSYQRDETVIAGEGTNTMVQDYRVQYTPTFLFVDKEGTIQFVHVGSELNEVILTSMSDLAFKTDLTDKFNTEEVVDVEVTESNTEEVTKEDKQ